MVEAACKELFKQQNPGQVGSCAQETVRLRKQTTVGLEAGRPREMQVSLPLTFHLNMVAKQPHSPATPMWYRYYWTTSYSLQR